MSARAVPAPQPRGTAWRGTLTPPHTHTTPQQHPKQPSKLSKTLGETSPNGGWGLLRQRGSRREKSCARWLGGSQVCPDVLCKRALLDDPEEDHAVACSELEHSGVRQCLDPLADPLDLQERVELRATNAEPAGAGASECKARLQYRLTTREGGKRLHPFLDGGLLVQDARSVRVVVATPVQRWVVSRRTLGCVRLVINRAPCRRFVQVLSRVCGRVCGQGILAGSRSPRGLDVRDQFLRRALSAECHRLCIKGRPAFRRSAAAEHNRGAARARAGQAGRRVELAAGLTSTTTCSTSEWVERAVSISASSMRKPRILTWLSSRPKHSRIGVAESSRRIQRTRSPVR